MDFAEEWIEPLIIMIVVGVVAVLGATVFYQYLDKARLTLSVAALDKARDTLKNYKAEHRSFPASLDFSNCSDQDHFVVLSCDDIKADINSFVSYVASVVEVAVVVGDKVNAGDVLFRLDDRQRKADRSAADDQKIIMDATKEAGAYQRNLVKNSEDQLLADLKSKGMQANTPADMKPFQDKVASVYQDFKPKMGDVLQKLLDATK